MSLCGLCTRRRKPEGSHPSTSLQSNLHLNHRDVTAYQYVPLNEEAHEIRLLTLLPGTFSSKIRLCLDITSFTQHLVPEFEAVSYAWGSTDNPINILIGKSGRETLAITQNLAKALPYLRYKDKPRILWIDAICVDQQNPKERGHQVKIMADIYSKAVKVLIWLGLESDDSSRAMDCLNYIASKVKVDFDTNSMSPATNDTHWGDIRVAPAINEVDVMAVFHFIQRPWFERLWIWQEVLLASEDTEAMCGSRSIPWVALRTAVFCLLAKPKPWLLFGQQLEFWARIEAVGNLCFGKKAQSIEHLIGITKSCICSDPRDKIYALLSLLWGVRAAIEPDYTKSVYEVYKHATLSLIEATGLLAVLNTVEVHEHLEGVPSWVPNWMVARPCDNLELSSASSKTHHSFNIDHEKRILKVEGVVVAVIQEVDPILLRPTHLDDEAIIELNRIATRAGFKGTAFQSHRHEAFTRAVSTNGFAERLSPPVNYLPSAKQSEKVLFGILMSDTNNDLEGSRDDLQLVLQHVKRVCQGRSFYITKEMVPGLGPLGTKPGDHVTVLLGCNRPMILRPTEYGSYKVVGEAYYDGYMDGEALLGPLPDSFKEVLKLHRRYLEWAYLNEDTGVFQAEDPRLGPLPLGWRLEWLSNNEFWPWFINDETGEESDWDPRLTSEALRKRGIPLQVFDLV